MPIIDISVTVRPGHTPTYPGDPGLEIELWSDLARGDSATVSVLRFGAHTGTHLDAPAHFIAGAATLDTLPLETLVGEAHVVELGDDVLTINAEHVRDLVPREAVRVLFKTRNSQFWEDPRGQFREDFTYLDGTGARALAERGVRLVGIDYLSIEQFNSHDFPAHKALLSRGVVILEGLDLRAAPPGRYELVCLPLKLVGPGGDGAPARAILRALD